MAKVLVVDDSSMSRRIIRRILESAGHNVIEAADGLSALEHYFLERPAVVMLDLTMKGMYGLDVLKKVKEIDPEACVVIASADIQDSTRLMAKEAGSDGFVTKPFKSEDLLGVVSAVLGGRGE